MLHSSCEEAGESRAQGLCYRPSTKPRGFCKEPRCSVSWRAPQQSLQSLLVIRDVDWLVQIWHLRFESEEEGLRSLMSASPQWSLLMRQHCCLTCVHSVHIQLWGELLGSSQWDFQRILVIILCNWWVEGKILNCGFKTTPGLWDLPLCYYYFKIQIKNSQKPLSFTQNCRRHENHWTTPRLWSFRPGVCFQHNIDLRFLL